jgi:hypothetical protein
MATRGFFDRVPFSDYRLLVGLTLTSRTRIGVAWQVRDLRAISASLSF